MGKQRRRDQVRETKRNPCARWCWMFCCFFQARLASHVCGSLLLFVFLDNMHPLEGTDGPRAVGGKRNARTRSCFQVLRAGVPAWNYSPSNSACRVEV